MASRQLDLVILLAALSLLEGAELVGQATPCTGAFTAPPGGASAVNDAPHWVASGDFNGDSLLDLVTANQATDDVSLLLGQGDGAFQAAVHFAAGNLPQSVAVADLNGDGFADLAVANDTSGDVSILLGRGDGTFQAPVNYPASSRPVEVVVGDFNEDGALDLAVCNQVSRDVSILIGNGSPGPGDGTFQSRVNYAVHGSTQNLAAGDFDGDGVLDLCATNHDTNDVTVLFGDGDGTFTSGGNYPANAWPGRVACADFNEDGYKDVAISNWTASSVSVLLSNGTKVGAFQTPVAYAVHNQPQGIIAEDLNLDGIVDLAVAGQGTAEAAILFGRGSGDVGDGTFHPTQFFAAGSTPVGLARGDINRDGLSDLAVSNHGVDAVTVLLNTMPRVENPVLNPGAGTYIGGPDILVDCPTGGATIHYTLDGNEPDTLDPSVAPGGTISLAGSADLKLKAFKDCWIPTVTATATYTVLPPPSRALLAGQNLIAGPLLPADGSWSAWSEVLGLTPQEVHEWDPLTALYEESPAPAADLPAPGRGFWVQVPADDTAVLEGVLPATPVIVDLVGGAGGRWNLIGNPFTSTLSWNADQIEVSSGGGAPMSLREAEAQGWLRSFGWVQIDGEYRLLCDPSVLDVGGSVEVLEPGAGCWIRVFQDCQLILES